jgi:diguanylate cyclase (GGDEF)-like protein
MVQHAFIRADLRQHASSLLHARSDIIAADAAGIFSRSQTIDRTGSERLARLLAELLAIAVGDERLDGRHGMVAHLQQVASELQLTVSELFSFLHMFERIALDELALDPDIGAATEAWPLVAQLVRRGSFDVAAALAADAAGSNGESRTWATGVLSRSLFALVVSKEAERARRFRDPIALIVWSVDRPAELDEQHGPGMRSRIVDRLSILVRDYFRRHDWIGRPHADSVAVLLTRDDADHAGDLADEVRSTVEKRFGFESRSAGTTRVTVSAAVTNVEASTDRATDVERLFLEAEKALDSARRDGGNRVCHVVRAAATRTPPRSSPSA